MVYYLILIIVLIITIIGLLISKYINEQKEIKQREYQAIIQGYKKISRGIFVKG